MFSRLEMAALALIDRRDDWRQVCEELQTRLVESGQTAPSKPEAIGFVLRKAGLAMELVNEDGPNRWTVSGAGKELLSDWEYREELDSALESGIAALGRFVTHTDQPVVERLISGLDGAPQYARMICIAALVLAPEEQERIIGHILETGSSRLLVVALDIWSPEEPAEPGTLDPPFSEPLLEEFITAGLSAEETETRRHAVAYICGLGWGDRFASVLTRFLIHPDRALRNASVLALGTANDHFSLQALEAALERASEEDREIYEQALSRRLTGS